MSSLLNIGLTGLNASQAQLNTTSHNITNAATLGYHRQAVSQAARDPQGLGGAFFGTGTMVSGVTRAYSQLLENQVMNADSRRADYAAYNQYISQVDNVLADADTGLTPALNEFFGAMQSVSSNPTNVAARQALISSGETLTARFRTLDARVSEIAQGVQGEIGATLGSINSYAEAIAELNQRIAVSQANVGGAAASDLLDQRQQAIAELNQLVKVSTVTARDGSLSVFIGSGQNLVMGSRAKELLIGDKLDENGRPMVLIRSAGNEATPIAETLLSGGALGGLLAVRRDGLEPAQRSLGLLAATMATAFNEQHELGVDLNGRMGSAFFDFAPVRVDPAGTVSASINPEQLAGLTGSDYALSYDGTRYVMTDIGTGEQQAVTPAVGGTLQYKGLNLEGLDGLVAGNRVFIYPTRFAAGSIEMAISDPRTVAAAAPVVSAAAASNSGTARITDIRIASSEGMANTSGVPVFNPAALTFTEASGVFTLQVSPAGEYSFVGGDTYTPVSESAGKIFTLQNSAGFSYEFKLSGVPAVTGDGFSLSANTTGIADNRNAALLGALQTDKLMFGGGTTGNTPTATLNNAYAQLVAKIGSKTREVQAGERTQTSLLEQAQAARDSVSAVNLDEEAANLVRFQQSYQAAGRVMSVAQRLFDEMLSIGR